MIPNFIAYTCRDTIYKNSVKENIKETLELCVQREIISFLYLLFYCSYISYLYALIFAFICFLCIICLFVYVCVSC